MKTTFVLGILLTLQLSFAQKVVKKSIFEPNTTLVQIDASNCYQIEVSTENTDEVILEAVIDGEYKKDLLLKTQKNGNTLSIGAGFQPNFKNPNDKLSAHKVVSVSLNIILPAYQQVQVFGTNCNVEARGEYKSLKVTLDDGYCHLYNISESASILTQSGEIEVRSSGGSFKASSKYGTIHQDKIPVGQNHFVLTSTTGDIKIKKTD